MTTIAFLKKQYIKKSNNNKIDYIKNHKSIIVVMEKNKWPTPSNFIKTEVQQNTW